MSKEPDLILHPYNEDEENPILFAIDEGSDSNPLPLPLPPSEMVDDQFEIEVFHVRLIQDCINT